MTNVTTTSVTAEDVATTLRNADRILLLAHQYPDGDTIGSNFALCLALQSLGKAVRVACEDPFPERYAYLYENIPQQDFVPQMICAVDVADARLLGPGMQATYGDRVDLSIDHHATNSSFARQTFVDSSCAAAAMIVYRIIKLLGVELTVPIAECLYTGIATDTGCFKYSNAGGDAHRIAAECIETGINFDMINRVNFDIKSRARIELERMALDQMTFYYDGRVAVMVITNDMVEKSGVKENDMEGLPPIPRQIEGVWVGITLRQKKDGNYKISVRTGTHANASHICSVLGGGGHDRAAGCTVEGTAEEAKAVILQAVEQTVPRIVTG